MEIAETLEYIHSVKWQGRKPGLERTRELLKVLGNPEKSLKFVHIAGTNGKGSTAACIASVLQKSGYRTGLYTSPYIRRFNERIRVNGEDIPDNELMRLTEEIRPYADVMEDSPTEFELITALAMKHFLNSRCDIVVLEVGMGGELDSTNVIEKPEVAVITSIGYDHVRELGPTISDIALAKAGIIKSGGDVVIYGGNTEVEDVFNRVSAERGVRLLRANFSRVSEVEFSLESIRFKFAPYGEIVLPLVGSYQVYNAAVAITALELLRSKGFKISAGDIFSGLASVKWPGRFEILGRDPVFVLDGAHNPQGAEAAANSLRRHFAGQKIVFVVGVMADKDVNAMMNAIAPLADSFIAVRPNHQRALDAKTLCGILSRYGVPTKGYSSIWDGVAAALRKADSGTGAIKCGIVCALGSLYFSEDIRAAYMALSV
ncbi:MAG: bifunctional folylpolyglutamate synthase/dihydrofolate synthase [Oscillospiraceae bacterium]|nr:bifunctional folylpolyglutamate synthase/dihydrofolate synthase [Oscillospiraceae bacterium]